MSGIADDGRNDDAADRQRFLGDHRERGSTALGVAAARAAETESENPLIQDPFARAFLDAAGEGMWSLTSDPQLAAELTDLAPELRRASQVMIDFMAVRTAWFDEFFLDAVSSGLRQVVILAAGLDAARGGCRGRTGPRCTSWIRRRCWISSRAPCSAAAHSRRRGW